MSNHRLGAHSLLAEDPSYENFQRLQMNAKDWLLRASYGHISARYVLMDSAIEALPNMELWTLKIAPTTNALAFWALYWLAEDYWRAPTMERRLLPSTIQEAIEKMGQGWLPQNTILGEANPLSLWAEFFQSALKVQHYTVQQKLRCELPYELHCFQRLPTTRAPLLSPEEQRQAKHFCSGPLFVRPVQELFNFSDQPGQTSQPRSLQ